VPERNGKRYDDHAGKSEIEVHGSVHPGPFESGAILPGCGQKKKFGFVIPMIEAIDTCVVFTDRLG